MAMFIFIIEINKVYFGPLSQVGNYGMPFPTNKNLKQGEALEHGFSVLALDVLG